jgi:GNAT superfamily N-acetyltransferase
MREPPAELPDIAGVPFDIARLAGADLAAYRDVFRRVGQDWLWFSRLQMDDRELGAVLSHPSVEVYFLIANDSAEGLLELDARAYPDIELAFFGVTPTLVGRGAGRLLMAKAIESAWQRKPSRLWVHTCSIDHPKALAFYRRAGFHPYKRGLEIADDPRLSGLLPQSAAPHIPLIKG